jgi:hypothetical protein
MKKHIEVGSEFCELGLFVLNAVCHEFSVLTHSQGQQAEFLFKQGELMNLVEVIESDHPLHQH